MKSKVRVKPVAAAKVAAAKVAAAKVAATEGSLVTRGQRRVNLIWEFTQATIAITVTLATLFTSILLTIRSDVNVAAFVLLSNAFFLVIGFYFGRTNHQKIGGVSSSKSEYEGR